MQPEHTPVLIVGGGPVGLALAGDLGWRGVSSILIEKTDGSILQPKMDMIHQRTMEFCRRWGIVDWVESAGYNRAYTQDYAWVTALAGGWELGRESFPAPRNAVPPPQSPQHKERCPQNFFDPVMRRFAERSGLATLHHETELVGFEDHGDRVLATVRDVRSGETRTVTADYLVGCDGASSKVREATGITMSGNPVLTQTTNVVFRAEKLERLFDVDPAYRFIFIGPDGTWCTLVAINGTDQWRFSFIGEADRATLTTAEMRDAIIRAVGREFDFEILSTMPWTRRELTADHYRKGRALLCGDAAHLLSPTGGFGMTTGLQEAVDLGWKLAGVTQGWAPDALLDSYEMERRPVAARNVGEAAVNLARMLAPRKQPPSPTVFEHGPAGDVARKAYGDFYTDVMKPEWFTLGVTMGYRYGGSPIIMPDAAPEPPNEVSTYTQTTYPGARAPHVWMRDGRSTLDLFGKTFVLVRFGEGGDAMVEAARAASVPLDVADIDEACVRDAYERLYVLVRPDGHVAWRSNDAPDADEARRVIDVVRGVAIAWPAQAAA